MEIIWTVKVFRVVAGVAIGENGAFLAMRAPHKSLAGLWEFPGGKVEEGESDQEALVREFQEEFKIEVIPGPFLCQSTTADGHINLLAYRIEFKGNPMSSNSHDNLCWFTKEQLAELQVCPADERIVKEVMKLL